ncbi:MAG TPA: tRNA pseudouridine(55) synthase TruB [Steroidobacteraceae bacterium]|nr:tRNA pseudouridine(55) synthase TruB [Steroidobacteraceae bacterium]
MPTGILLLDKPLGLSSNRALQTVRRALGARKAGHLGTLDPLATGMLPICLDEATKVIALIEGGRKAYRFGIALGTRTTTGDTEGTVAETRLVPSLEAGAIKAQLASLRGEQWQVPPMYSALKRDGEPLYRLARAGIEVERKPRRVELYRLELLAQGDARLVLECECSKGTYVRVLAEQIATALGTCGHVDELRRLSVEPFEAQTMVSLEELLADPAQAVVAHLKRADSAVQSLPALAFAPHDVSALRQGRSVALAVATVPQNVPGGPSVAARGRAPGQDTLRVRLYALAAPGEFLGLGEIVGEVVLPRRLFVPLDST